MGRISPRYALKTSTESLIQKTLEVAVGVVAIVGTCRIVVCLTGFGIYEIRPSVPYVSDGATSGENVGLSATPGREHPSTSCWPRSPSTARCWPAMVFGTQNQDHGGETRPHGPSGTSATRELLVDEEESKPLHSRPIFTTDIPNLKDQIASEKPLHTWLVARWFQPVLKRA